MSKDTKETQVERYSKYRHVQATIKLNQIEVDTDAYCHRVEEKLKPEKLEELSQSLAQEGQQTPLVVIKSQTSNMFLLIAGHRRFYGFEQGIKDGLPDFADDMDVAVTIMEQGKGQSEKDFRQDVNVRSISDNSNREAFDDFEKLKNARKLIGWKVQKQRAMSALGVKESQYSRYRYIVETSWLYDAVINGKIKTTSAARLVEVARQCDDAKDRSEVKNPNVKRMGLFEKGFNDWVTEAQEQLEADNQWRAANNKKPLEGRQAYLSRYFSVGLLLHWEKNLAEGISFDQSKPGGFKFLVKIDTKKLTLEIPRVNLKLDDLDESKLAEVIGGLEDGVIAVSGLLVEVQRKQPVSIEEAKAALAIVRQNRDGDPAKDFDKVDEPQITNVSAVIKKQRSSKNGGAN